MEDVTITKVELEDDRVLITQAEQMLRDCIDCKVRKQKTLCDLKVENNPRGNKLWEIELVLHGPVSQELSTGFFACHQSKDFITYSVTLNGDEHWFDRYHLALEFLGFPLEDLSMKN